MKPSCITFLLAVCALCLLAAPASADLPKLRKAVDQLQAAKKSNDPMPLLLSAQKLLTNANKGDKLGDRSEGLEYVNAAIEELKSGDRKKMEQKINAAIANIHQGKDKAK